MCVLPTLTLLKDCRQVDLYSVDSLALRLVDAHCPSEDQRYLYTKIRVPIFGASSEKIYLLARRLDLSKAVDNIKLGWSEKKCVFTLVKMHNRPLWPIRDVQRQFV